MANKKNNEIVEKTTDKPSRGRGGKNNFPNARLPVKTAEDRALVSKLLGEVLVEYRQTRVTSDEELSKRLDDYFRRCSETGQIPTVEEMCMCTGYSYQTCWDWENGRNKGFSSRTSEIMKKAREFLKTFDAKLVISGKMNFLAYCFRAKNYYGMVDRQEHVLTPNVKQPDDYNAEEIKKRYLLDSGIDYQNEND